MAIHRVVRLAVTAFCLGRLTLVQDQQAPWLGAARRSPTGQLTPPSFQRLYRALRRLGLQRIFVASAPGADFEKTEGSYEQIFRIAASHQVFSVIPRSAPGVSSCKGIEESDQKIEVKTG